MPTTELLTEGRRRRRNEIVHGTTVLGQDDIDLNLMLDAAAKEDGFPQRLEKQMQKVGLTQSDLARAVWGSTKDGRGYSVARNRDRISSYLQGAGMPEPDNLKKLAVALKCTVEDLVGPEGTMRPVTRNRALVGIHMGTVPGQPDWMDVQVQMKLPMDKALEIFQIIRSVVQPEPDEDDGN